MKKYVILITFIIAGYAFYLSGNKFDQAVLRGKRVLVTGASSGIGEQIAYNYARLGANVIVTARRGKLLEKVVERCKSIGSPEAKFSYVAMDMNSPENTQSVIKKTVSALGGIDHLILNHAYFQDWTFWSGSDSDFQVLDRMLDVNMKSFVRLTSYALPNLIENNGSIAVVSSLAGKLTSPLCSSYSASKYALDGFFSGLRQELLLKKRNVSITLCVLGLIATEQASKIPESVKERLPPAASVNDTAMAIIRGTTLRLREMLYPNDFFFEFIVKLRDWIPELLEYNLRENIYKDISVDEITETIVI